jgi:AcrR family transcriptional regulator
MARKQKVGLESSATRKALLDAAEVLMAEEGYAAVTSRKLAAKAGIAPPLVHYYFPSMDDLFVELVRRMSDRRQAYVSEALQSANPLRAFWDLSSNSGEVSLTFELMALANHRKIIRAEIAQCGEQYRELQRTALARFFEEHGIEPEMSPDTVAFIMTALGSLKVMEQAVGISFAHGEIATLVEERLKAFEATLSPGINAPKAKKAQK